MFKYVVSVIQLKIMLEFSNFVEAILKYKHRFFNCKCMTLVNAFNALNASFKFKYTHTYNVRR